MAVGIIAEYNPFHNGHKYQLEEAMKKFPGEDIVIVLSGKYVQRGELAIANYEDRKQMALQHGATKVVELPQEYAIQAAHIFCEGAVKTAFANGVNKLFFGSESNNPEMLMKIAHAIFDNEEKYNLHIKHYIGQGLAFPKAAALALSELIGKQITLPNDILGLEYCKAIVKNKLPMVPYTLKRTVDFHSETPNNHFASASYIRKLVHEGKDYSMYTPMKLEKNPDRIQNYYSQFQAIVRNTPREELAKIKMVSEGMENLFKKNIDIPTYDEFVNKVNSKRYTSSRIKRVMLQILLSKEK